MSAETNGDGPPTAARMQHESSRSRSGSNSPQPTPSEEEFGIDANFLRFICRNIRVNAYYSAAISNDGYLYRQLLRQIGKQSVVTMKQIQSLNHHQSAQSQYQSLNWSLDQNQQYKHAVGEEEGGGEEEEDGTVTEEEECVHKM